MISVPEQELAHLLLSAFRYALGRQTYITGQTADWLAKYWRVMPQQWREQIHRDIEAAIERGEAGMSCDVKEWRRVLALPIAATSEVKHAE